MKKIIFVTGTRADYGKLKSLMVKLQKNKNFKSYICVTGMHNLADFGSTWEKISKKKYDNLQNVIRFSNQNKNDPMDKILSNTIIKFSKIVKKIKPDLIIIHGDRIEALACATVGALNNFRTAHIEGGEVSGTVDEILRHSISKLSHIHFTTNRKAKERLIQLGEIPKNIYILGSPDIDILKSKNLPSLNEVKYHYDINFENYGIVLYHSVTTEIEKIPIYSKILVNSILRSKKNFVIIFPNNDNGSDCILKEYYKFRNNKRIRLLPSMRFEYYLTLLKNSNLIIGNSSSGIMEAPFYGIPTINIGNRQNKRSKSKSIINIDFNKNEIIKRINTFFKIKKRYKKNLEFGKGNSAELFLKILNQKQIWITETQKTFRDI